MSLIFRVLFKISYRRLVLNEATIVAVFVESLVARAHVSSAVLFLLLSLPIDSLLT